MRSIRWLVAGLVAVPFLATPALIGADGTQDGNPPVAKPADAAKPAAETPGAAELGLLRNAPDPSSAIEAYTRALAAAPKDLPVKIAFVRRMVDFGLPEMADTQALDVVSKDQGNGLAWGVLAYMNAKRGRTADALSDVVLATNRDSRDPFILRTAGQLLAWYDTRADKAQVPDDVKASVETMRTAVEKRPACADAYRRAHDAYAAKSDDANDESSPPAGPPSSGPAPSLVQPAEPGASNPPPAAPSDGPPQQLVVRDDDQVREVVVREPEIRYVYDTTYVYTDPYVYACRPTVVYSDPWWPTTSWCGGWYGGWYGGCGSGWGASVLVGYSGWGLGFTWWGGGCGWNSCWNDCDDDDNNCNNDWNHNNSNNNSNNDNWSSGKHSGDGSGKSAAHGGSRGANGARHGGSGAASNNGADAVAASGARRGGARGTSGQHAGDATARADGSSSRAGARTTTAPRTPRSAWSSGARASGRTAAAHSGDGFSSSSRASFPQSRGAYSRSYTPSRSSFGSSPRAPYAHSAVGASSRSYSSPSRSYSAPSRSYASPSRGSVRSSSFGGGGGGRSFSGGGGHVGSGGGHGGSRGR